MTKMTSTTDLRSIVDKQIHRLSEMDEEELITLQSVLERAHVHILIERHLRDGLRVSGVDARP